MEGINLVKIVICILLFGATQSFAGNNKEPVPLVSNYIATPDRKQGEGDGPYKRLIIRGATVIDGTGAPPTGPMDIIIEGNRIVDIVSVGYPHQKIDEKKRPQQSTKEIDAHGAYVLPGFVDVHVHTGVGIEKSGPEMIYKLWLAHGVTTVRGVMAGPMEWSLSERERSEKNEIVAPRIVVYQRPGQGKKWKNKKILSPIDAREWVKYAAKNGLDGIKLTSYRPAIMKALLDEAEKHKLGSTAHLAQSGVAQMNALDAARLGLGSMTHNYGLFEALYKSHDLQPFPFSMNASDEQNRFRQIGRQWNLIHERGSEEWNALLDEFLSLDFYINPTLAIHSASRDLMRARNADWHEIYVSPLQWKFFQANRATHGSYWYNWTTRDEVAWKNFYRIWMSFLNDYKNKGGKVTFGSDSGFIYSLYGFGAIQELELLQEAGFHPLEVIRAATMHSAMEIAKPTGKPIKYGVLRPGLMADMIIVEENPLENLKVLYGTGARRLNDTTGKMERIGGIKYTIKDGIVYDTKKLLKDVARMVEDEKNEITSDIGK